MPLNRIANIYVPARPGSIDHLIRPGSGIVALSEQASANGYIVLYYEGNVHGAINLRRYQERIKCAAGRMFQKYPTTALIALPLSDLEDYVQVVGTIDETYMLSFTDDIAAFAYGSLL